MGRRKKSNWGGKRKGAGRKPVAGEPLAKVYGSLPRDLIEAIKLEGEKHGRSFAEQMRVDLDSLYE